jgi:hypothetical protein
MALTPWARARFNVAAGSEAEKALIDWQHAIRRAIDEGDASKLALRLVHEGAPPPLRELLYHLVIAAPWRDPRPGAPRKLNAVDEVGVVSLYTMLACGLLLPHRRRQSRAAIIDHISHRYGGISKSAIERVLKKHGGAAMPKPPRVLKPKPRR